MIHAMQSQATQAMIRFGLGRRGDEPLPADPHAWLAAQLSAPDPALWPATLPGTSDALLLLREQRRLKPPPGASLIEPIFRAEAAAQLGALLTSEAPFRERLVWFWANHFTVSTRQGATRALVGAYVRETIRPHVTARFADMLLAVMRSPAMLMYLDNQASVGPDSVAGQRSGRGLNENLARECLELHTLGVHGGYSQADVTAFAQVLTGWSIDHAAAAPGFVFKPGAHEPGDRMLLGRMMPQGEDGGVVALDMLATHPATYRHLATQLVTHFVSDTPPPDDVARIASVLHDSQGDLGAASLALTQLDGAWRPLAKFRAPLDYAVAVCRALALPPEALADHPGMLQSLGQPLWAAPLPNGWPDRQGDWASPGGMLSRIDWSYDMSGRAAPDASAREPLAIAQASLGPLLRPQTETAILHAGDRRDALTLLFSSPEFQRR